MSKRWWQNRLMQYTAVLIVMFVIFVGRAGGKTPDYEPMLNQGIAVLDKGKPDSAIVCFVQAYASGLPKDSLFFYWAEALLHKGVLDSALAANFIAASSTSSALRMMAQLQRYSIYRMLGWNNDADKLLDTIRTTQDYSKTSPIPEIDIGITGGYGAEHRGSDTALPWGSGFGSSFYDDDKGVFGRADIKSTWGLVKGKRSLSAGLAAAASYRQYTPGGLRNAADSTDVTGALFTTVSGKRLSSTASLALNRRVDDSLFIQGGIEGGYVGAGRFLPMLWGGGALSLATDGKVSNSRLWVFTLAQYNVAKMLNLTGSVYANAYLAHKLSYGFVSDTANVLYAEDARLQYPVFYTDASYAKVIDTIAYMYLSDNIKKSKTDTMIYLGLQQPISNLMINPRVSTTINSKLPVQLGVSWRWNYYFEKHEWDQTLTYAHYLIYSRSDDNYYTIPEGLLVEELTITRINGQLAIDPSAQPGYLFIHHSKRRIDNTLSADVSIELFDGRFGTGTLRASGSKTWSTLLNVAPVEIPEWSLSTSLEWRFSYAEKQGRR